MRNDVNKDKRYKCFYILVIFCKGNIFNPYSLTDRRRLEENALESKIYIYLSF